MILTNSGNTDKNNCSIMDIITTDFPEYKGVLTGILERPG